MSDIRRKAKERAQARKKGSMKGMSVKSGDKRPTKSGAGMTQKGVEKYRRQNPGSKLKTAVTEKNPSKSRAAAKSWQANQTTSSCQI